MNAEKHRLDDLLARLPLPTPQRDRSSAAFADPNGERWAKQLASTLERVELDDVLRTPLPLEAGEPDPANEALDTDPLRAPLKSGEHSPYRLVDARQPSLSHVALPMARQRSRFALTWVLGGATTLVAAAATLGLFIRSERQAAHALRDTPPDASPSAVTAPSQPNAEAGRGQATPVAVAVAVLAPKRETEPARVALAAERPAAINPAPGAKSAALKSAAKYAVGETAAATEPPLTPAAGPSNLADHPTVGAILAAFAPKKGLAARCLPAHTGSTRVALTFGSSGKVTQVVVLDSTLDAATQRCIQAALGSIQVDPFAKKQYEATLTLSNP